MDSMIAREKQFVSIDQKVSHCCANS